MKKQLTISEKTKASHSLRVQEHFYTDLNLFKKHFPLSHLNNELARVNRYNIDRLHGQIIYLLLDKVSQDEIEANRLTKEEAVTAELKAKEAAELKAKEEADAAELRAKEDAELKAKEEADAAELKAKEDAELKAKEEADAAELKAKEDAELKAKEEADAAELIAKEAANINTDETKEESPVVENEKKSDKNLTNSQE